MTKNVDQGGRPRIEIDMEELRRLVAIQCTAQECATVLGCSVDTLDRRIKEHGFDGFADYFEQNRGVGCTSLRRRQFEAAEAGNPAMLIWLGKQWLGQSDKQTLEHSGPDGGDIKVSSDLDVAKAIAFLLTKGE